MHRYHSGAYLAKDPGSSHGHGMDAARLGFIGKTPDRNAFSQVLELYGEITLIPVRYLFLANNYSAAHFTYG
jgi:hypothetical protein